MSYDENNTWYIGIPIIALLLLIFIGSSNPSSYVMNDEITEITYQHEKVHKGELWFVRNYSVLPSGANTSIILHTGPKNVHLLFEASNTIEALYKICENVTIISNGTKLQEFNRNRNYMGDDGVDIFAGGTYSSCSGILAEARLGDGKKVGSQVRSQNEYVLRANTSYVLYVENLETVENVINYYLEWYEGMDYK